MLLSCLGCSIKKASLIVIVLCPGTVAKQRVDYLIPWLPHFFVAEGEQLEQSVKAAISLCEVENTNQYMLVRDEVAYSKTWQLVAGLLPEQPDTPAAVGGAHPEKALVPYDDDMLTKKDLKKEDLAPLSVCTILKRRAWIGMYLNCMFEHTVI